MIQTSDGFTVNFHGADPSDPEVCVWDSVRQGKKNQGRFLYALHNVGDHSIRLDQIRDAYRELFPLAVGKTVQKLVGGEAFNSELRLKLTVESIVEMNIGSETHRAWLIHEQGFGTLGSKTTIDNYYWMEVGTFVLLKMYESRNGARNSFDVVNIHMR